MEDNGAANLHAKYFPGANLTVIFNWGGGVHVHWEDVGPPVDLGDISALPGRYRASDYGWGLEPHYANHRRIHPFLRWTDVPAEITSEVRVLIREMRDAMRSAPEE